MPVTRRSGVISLLLLAAIAAGSAQQRLPPPIPAGTSAIRGRIIDSITKAPVAGCSIRVAASGYVTTLVSDLAGAYELKNVGAGDYNFLIQCKAHIPRCLDEPNRCRIEVLRDQEREGADFLVAPGAIVRGQVLTFDGRPVTRANVRLGRGLNGEPTFALVTPSTTDTEGRFELINLPAGKWRVEVEIPPVAGGLRPPVVYYPGGLSWEEAGGVELDAGKVIDDLMITVPRINENSLTVMLAPPDATIADLVVSVLRESPLAVQRISLNSEGIGTLKGVVPGRYFAAARASSRDKQWAAFEVVDFLEGEYEARLQLMPTGHITGKIVTDKGPLPPLNGVIAGASWIYDGEEVNPLSVDEAPVNPDGSFRIDNVFGTRKLQLRALDLDWEVAAIRQGRTDVTSSGVVVVSDATTEATIVLRRR